MRILLVSEEYPNDMSFGAGQRTTLLHKALLQIAEVTMLVLKEGQPLGHKQAPAAGVIAEIDYPASRLRKYRSIPAIEPMVRAVVDIDAFDMVVGRHLGPPLALPKFRGLTIIDNDDAYYQYPAADTTLSRVLAAARTRARLQVSRRVLRRVDHTWFCCERDINLFSVKSSSILPNVIGAANVTAESVSEATPTVLMVGSLWYRPNRDAIDTFLQTCWPEIRRQVPDARFRAVGAAPIERRQRWASVAGVECPGFVDDLSSEYRHASLTVVPVRSGGGTQIKTLESLAHGRVPVVSSFVAGGFAPHLKHGESLYIADDSSAQIERVTAMLKNPVSAEPVARRGQQIVRETFSHERFAEAVKMTIASIAGQRKV
jgi:polysaccharide biosynthesis protein PslH